MVLCAVPWCVALAAPESQHCPVHRRSATIRPELLTDEDYERLSMLGAGHALCDDCHGTGECRWCEGEASFACACDCGELNHRRRCDECAGRGECATCKGRKVVAVRGIKDPDWWRWHRSYREQEKD